MGTDVKRSRLCLLASMCIFGTIGLLRRSLPVPSGFLAMMRGLFGSLSLLLFLRRLPDGRAVRANLAALCISGAMIGCNWILMFEAYRFTTVATATLCYYMAPVFVLLLAPLVLHERLTPRRRVCVLAALAGMVLVSGVLRTGISVTDELRGVLCALGAAALYAAVVLLNKFIRGVGAIDKTIVQIGTGGLVLIPYVLMTEDLRAIQFTPKTVLLLAVACLIYTGLAYALYFSSIDALPAHSLALLSYLDPVIAVLLSALVLREPITAAEILGAVLILAAAAVAELPEKTGG